MQYLPARELRQHATSVDLLEARLDRAVGQPSVLRSGLAVADFAATELRHQQGLIIAGRLESVELELEQHSVDSKEQRYQLLIDQLEEEPVRRGSLG